MLNFSDKIKMVVSDFDGVFTDGSVYISEKNEVQKRKRHEKTSDNRL